MLYRQLSTGILAKAFFYTGLDRVTLNLVNTLYRRQYIRMVIYHDIPTELVPRFEEHVKFWARYFSPVSPDTMRDLLSSGRWTGQKPGIILSFDDGLRSWLHNVIPVLERYGFIGWFLVPSEFTSIPIHQQSDYARRHKISAIQPYEDGRYALSHDELRFLAKKHVVVCHSKTHRRLGPDIVEIEADEEIGGSKCDLERIIGQRIDAFGWVGGENEAYSSAAFEAIKRAKYKYSLMTKSAPLTKNTNPLEIHRTSIGIDMPTYLLRYQICGVMDLAYFAHRRAIHRRITTFKGRAAERR